MDPSQLIFLVLLIAMFYFLLIRPQQRRSREHQKLVSGINVGDEVVTIGGQYGIVKKQDDSTVWLEVDTDVEVRFAKQAISRKVAAADVEEPEEAEDAQADGS